VVDFSLDDYEHQLDLALSPLISAAKLVVTRTSQVVIGVVVFVIAVHVASAVLLRYALQQPCRTPETIQHNADRNHYNSDRNYDYPGRNNHN